MNGKLGKVRSNFLYFYRSCWSRGIKAVCILSAKYHENSK